jgi:hypothetical protein
MVEIDKQREEARRVLTDCDRLGIVVTIRPVLKPANLVTKELETAARAVADKLVEVVLERESDTAQFPAQGGVPCRHCKGAGLEPTALMLFEQLKYALLCLMWDVARVERLRTEIKPDEVLANMPRQGGIDLVDSKGNQRTLGKCDS